MAQDAAYIAGDWGTSSARFWLCDADGLVRDARTGRGIASFAGDAAAIAAHFAALTMDWDADLPAVLCGAVGSMSGWRDAGYQRCPADLASLGDAGLRFAAGGREILLLAGLRTRNAFGEPDVMRGEETQLAGAQALFDPAPTLVVLPGTHTKWCLVAGGRIAGFHTGMPGELHAILAAHSVLVGQAPSPATPGTGFEEGVALALGNRQVGLETLLFAVRARQATGEMAPGEAADFLSGLLIGSDVASVQRLHGEAFAQLPVVLVCSEALADLYCRALGQLGKECARLSGEGTVRAGLHRAWLARLQGRSA